MSTDCSIADHNSSKQIPPIPGPVEKLPHHPLADIFPMLSEAELEELATDIEKNGLIEKIALCEGMILDGRNRYEACLRRGIDPKTFNIPPEQALGYVTSRNITRRHLNESQRAMVAALLWEKVLGRDAWYTEVDSSNAASFNAYKKLLERRKIKRKDAAKLLNVSERSVSSALRVYEFGLPEVTDAVRNGKLAVSVAADIACEDKDLQAELLQKHTENRKKPGPIEGRMLTRRQEIAAALKKERRWKKQQDAPSACFIVTQFSADQMYLVEAAMSREGVLAREEFVAKIVMAYCSQRAN